MNNIDNAARTGEVAHTPLFSINQLVGLSKDLDSYTERNPGCSFFTPNDGARVRWLIEQNAALVEALETVLDCSEMQKGAGMSMLSMHHNGPALQKARAALALAKGGQQ